MPASSVESLVVQDTMIVTDFHSLRFFEWGIENCATHGDLNSLQLPQCVVKIAPCSRAMCKFLRHCRKGKFLQLKVRSLVLWGHYDICPTTLQMVLIVFSLASKKRVALVGLSKVLFFFWNFNPLPHLTQCSKLGMNSWGRFCLYYYIALVWLTALWRSPQRELEIGALKSNYPPNNSSNFTLWRTKYCSNNAATYSFSGLLWNLEILGVVQRTFLQVTWFALTFPYLVTKLIPPLHDFLWKIWLKLIWKWLHTFSVVVN